MRVLVAPQAFKGSVTATEVAAAMAAGLPAGATIVQLPLADGGEGTVDALLAALGGSRRLTSVSGPLGQPVTAAWGLLPDGRAVVEMAAASGLPLVTELDPRRASTFGTGQLLAAALDAGARELIVGIGGSATNDGGAGALVALGARLLDSSGKDLPLVTIHLQRLTRIDFSGLHPGLRTACLRVMCDVSNPLLGPQGATAVYGPQKGATPPMQPRLEAALVRWAEVLERDSGWAARPAAAVRLADVPGAGAAGGLGAGLLALGATLEPGAELVLDVAGFDQRLREADLVLTGEGLLDGQSVFGKTTVTVARRARRAGVPVLAIVGGLGAGYEACYAEGIDAVMPIAPGPLSLAESQARAAELIRATTERAFRMIGLTAHAPGSRRQ